jgi:hypothetical protein
MQCKPVYDKSVTGANVRVLVFKGRLGLLIREVLRSANTIKGFFSLGFLEC